MTDRYDEIATVGRFAGVSARQRFERNVDRSGECHRWVGAHNSEGYGLTSLDGRTRSAHAAALLLAGIDIPEGLTIDHVWAWGCKFKDCVRIDHLEIVTRRENTLRSNNQAALNARKTHCVNGHEFTLENTRIVEGGRRRKCLTCSRARSAASKRKRRAALRAAA